MEDLLFNSYEQPEEKLPIGGPVTMGDEIRVKEEPVELPAVVEQPTIASTEAMLPANQQAALQQLLASFVNYQAQYGLDVAAVPTAGINPSLLTVPATTASTPSMSAYTPASETSNAAAGPSKPAAPESVDEPLVSISDAAPSNRSTRAESTISTLSANDSIDEKIDKLVPLSSIFSAGRGKGGKKGGGMSSVVRGDDEMLDEDDSWRPSPEEYKKLSSKEKRQLRNKLSARAFRTRRKDYIGTLESHIKDRDTVIDAIRNELATSRNENQDLRRELEALKASTMNVLHPQTANQEGQSPALMKALAMGLTSSAPPARTTAAPAVNTRKDLASFDTSRGFWGGNDNMFGGGSTICHTLLTPELTLPPQPNLNPLLNNIEPASKPLSIESAGDRDINSQSFNDWAENTPFTMRSMDNYRIQLWSRLAREAAAEKANVPSHLRPKFLVEPKKEATPAVATPALAAVASAATEHVASKLVSSFWSAFAGPTSKLDADKLAAVVTGKARLAVVPEKRTSTSQPTEDALAHAMAGLKVATGTSSAENVKMRSPLSTMASYFKPPMTARA